MTIQVRVMAAQANRQLAGVESQLRRTAATAAIAGTGMRGAFTGASTAMVKWGSQVQWAGRQLQYNFTIPLTIAALAATKFALDNERSMVLVKKVYGDMEHSAITLSKEVDALGEAFVALSNHFGVNQSEVIKVAADWAAAGSSGLALAKATRLTLELMILGEMEAADATQALIAIQAQYGLTVGDLAKAVDTLNVVENQTGATMADLITGMARSAGVARTAGVDVTHLAAMMAALVPAAGNASMAGNGLKTIISRLLSPTQDAADLMAEMKMNVEDLAWQSMNGTQRLETFAQAFDKLSDSQKTQVTSTVAGRWQINRFDVLMRDIINPLGYYRKALAAASDELVNFNQRQFELNQVLSSNPQRLKQMWTMLQNALANVIQPLLPWIVLLAQKVAELFTSFSRLNPSIQKLVLAGLAFIAVFGLLARYVGVSAVLFGYLSKVFVRVLTPITGMAKGLGFLVRGVWALATLPFVVITRGFTGLTSLAVALKGVWALTVPSFVAVGTSASAAATVVSRDALAMGAVIDEVAWKIGIANKVQGDGFIIMSMQADTAATRLASAGGVFGVAGNFIKTKMVQASAFVQGFTATMGTTVPAAMATAASATGAGGAAMATIFSTALVPLPGIAFAAGSSTGAAFTTGLVAVTRAQLFGMYFAAVLQAMSRIPQIGFEAGMSTAVGFVRGVGTGLAVQSGMLQLAGAAAAGAVNVGFIAAQAVEVGMYTGAGARAGGAFALGVGSTAPLAITAGATVGGAATTGMVAGVVAGRGKILAAFAALGRGVLMVFGTVISGLLQFLVGGLAALGKFLLTPWGLLIAGVIALFIAFGDDIKRWFLGVVDSFRQNGSKIIGAFQPVVDFFHAVVKAIHNAFNSLPEGVQNALLTVVRIVQNAVLQVYEWFSYLNPFASHSPSLVESVTNGMAVITRAYASVGNVGAVFAKAASDLEAYKNLAASLNWDEWTSERADVAALLPAGLDLFNQLVEDLKPLNALLAEQNKLVSDQEKVVNGWKLQLNAANEALDQQEFILGNLKAQLDVIQASYDGHKAAMEDFANAGIEGQRAMSDAAFENEMAQKRLRLEIMQLEDAGGSVDDLLSRMAKLQGEIETLRGSANDLRAAGAGSDVLGSTNSQIDQMEAAYAAMSQGAGSSPINDLQRQLEELQRSGETLDLQNSLQFDPLLRQIDQLANGVAEVDFSTILAGIQNERVAMDALQPSLDAATQAYNDQKAIVDQYQAARDTLQQSYDLENNKLQYLRDEYQMTADAIGDIEEALRMVTGAAEAAGGALGGVGGAGSAGGAGGGSNLVPAADWEDVGGGAGLGREGTWDDQSAQIDEWTQSLIDETTAGLDKFDMFGPLRVKWDSFVAWWNANAVPAWHGLLDGMGEIGSTLGQNIDVSGVGDWFGDIWQSLLDFWNSVQPFIQDLSDLFGPQLQEIWDRVKTAIGPAVQVIVDEFSKWGDTLGGLWEILKPFVIWIGTNLVGVLSTAFSILGNVLGPVIEFIGDAIANILQFIRGLIDFVAGVFTGDWTRAWSGITTAFGAVWSFIVHILEAAWEILYGLVAGIVEGIVGFFQWLWDMVDEKVGGMVSSVGDWFTTLWNNISGWFSGLWNDFTEWFVGLAILFVEWIMGVYTNVTEWFGNIWTSISDWFSGLWKDTKDWLENLAIQYVLWVMGIWDSVSTWFTNIYNTISEKVSAVWTVITTKLGEIWTNIITWGQNIWNSIQTTWENVRLAIWNKIVEIVTNVRDKFEEIRTSIWDKITTVRDQVTEVFGTVRDSIMGAFESVRDRIGGVFDSITNFIKSGINVGISAVNGLIDGLNKVADILPGLEWHINAIPLLLAQGGAVPGRQVGAGFKANQARAIVGEGNSNYPEYVIPTDPKYRGRAEDLFSQLAKQLDMGTDDPRLGIGGWDDIVSAVGNAIGNGVDLLQEGAEWVGDAARGAVSKIMEPIKNMAQEQINGMTWEMGKSWAQSGLDNIWQWITGADDAYKTAGTQVGGAWKKPLSSYTISSQFGSRIHPITGLRTFHSGLDMATASGSPIYAASTGQLSRNTMLGGLGKYMSIAHNNGMTSMYGHMSNFVKANGLVTLGQVIGQVGSTGNSTGPHLHFELRQNGSAIDPRSYMSTMGITLAGGGIVRRQAGGIMANLGEGRYDEAVVPLPNGWQGMGNKIATMTVQRLAVVGSIEGRGVETLQPATHIENNTYNFYGDLEFPNVTNGDDAEVFLNNLSTLAGGSNR